jgi:two-component system chemotaxis response regulator CheB
MRSTIKVLIVDDSALIRQMLTHALTLDPRIEIVGVAKTGVEAIERARELQPDVITLDIEKYSSARVVMLSSLDDPDTTYAALSAGAMDFISKPKGGFASSLTDLSELLLKKIKTAYRVNPDRVGSLETATEHGSVPASDRMPEATALGDGAARLGAAAPTRTTTAARAQTIRRGVAIAASTGGPPALERVFSGLSASLPAAYFIVQHLPAGFSNSLAKRLGTVSDIRVVEAENNMPVAGGTGYVAPHGTHMTVQPTGKGGYRLRLEDAPPVHGVRPAADPLFESMARTFGEEAVGVVLTGMGSDGARGLIKVQEQGGETIAQNEDTSVVWGMPGAAVKAGAVRHVVPVGLVAAEIRRTLRDWE